MQVPPRGGAPNISGQSPTTGRAGQSLTVTLRGTNFLAGATANFGEGITVSSVVVHGVGPRADHLLECEIEIAINVVPGPRTVTATNPGGMSATSPQAFTVTPAGPSLKSFTLTPSPVPSRKTVTGRVELTAKAPRGGARVTFRSETEGFPAPRAVTVPSGRTRPANPFTFSAPRVTARTEVRYVASYGGISIPVTLIVNPAR